MALNSVHASATLASLSAIDTALDDSTSPKLRSVSELAFAWYPGTMRPYESMESIAAKWCLLNRLGATQFEKWANNVVERRCGRGGAMAHASYDLEPDEIAKAFGEPLAVTRKLRPRQSIENSRFGADGLQLGKPVHTFRFCRTCLKNGFHSELHEVPWLGFCFVHPEVELASGVSGLDFGTVPPVREPDRSFVSRVRYLMRLWGGSRPLFPLPAAWTWRKKASNPVSSRRAASLLADIAAVSSCEKGLWSQEGASRGLSPSIWGTPVESIAPRVKFWLNRTPQWLKLVAPGGRNVSGMSSPRSLAKLRFFASIDEQMIALDKLCIVQLRINEVFEADEWPEWRLLYDRVAQALVSGHRGCQAVYDTACRPLLPLSTQGLESSGQSSYVLARIFSFGRLSCEQLQFGATWQRLFDLVKAVLPLHNAPSHTLAQERLRAQRALVEYRNSSADSCVDAFDAAALEALLGFHLPRPVSDRINLADAILHEIVLAAAWALDVMLARHTVRGKSADDGVEFVQVFRVLHPLVVMCPHESAIELNMTAYVPAMLPKWACRLSSATDPDHLLLAANDAERFAQMLRSGR